MLLKGVVVKKLLAANVAVKTSYPLMHGPDMRVETSFVAEYFTTHRAGSRFPGVQLRAIFRA